MSLSECKESYTECLEKQNNMVVNDNPIITSNCESSISTQLGLKYITSKSQSSQVGKIANSTIKVCQQYALNEDPTLNQTPGCNMFNIQLNYNPN